MSTKVIGYGEIIFANAAATLSRTSGKLLSDITDLDSDLTFTLAMASSYELGEEAFGNISVRFASDNIDAAIAKLLAIKEKLAKRATNGEAQP